VKWPIPQQRSEMKKCSGLGLLLLVQVVVIASTPGLCQRSETNNWSRAPQVKKCAEKSGTVHPLLNPQSEFRARVQSNEEEQNDPPKLIWSPPGADTDNGPSYRLRRSSSRAIPPLEAAYMRERRAVEDVEFHSYAVRNGIRQESATGRNECTETAPRLGVAISGGSLRSYLNAAGILSAMDKRMPGAEEAGTGGLLQSLSYIAGESGGAWLLGSWFAQGLPTFQDMLRNIHLNESIVFPGGQSNVPFFGKVITETLRATTQKRLNGFNVSLADVYSGLISQQLLPPSSEVPFDASDDGLTLSSLAKVPSVQNYSAPIPLMISLQKDKATFRTGMDSCPPANIWEWSIFESGTFGKSVDGFVRSDMIGNELKNGKITGDTCVEGADNLPWVLATATAAYSQALHKEPIVERLEECMKGDNRFASAVCHLLRYNIIDLALDRDTEKNHLTAPAHTANPFLEYGMSENRGDKEIYFTDVGPCEQIPLFSLFQEGRDLDVVFALDATEGDSNWPSGLALSLSASHARHVGLSIPDTPSLDTFVENKNLTNRASFHGCYDFDSPALVYIPNHEVSFASNFSYSKLQWDESEQYAMLQNGFDQLTEEDLPECLSCLLASRQHDMCSERVTREVSDFWREDNVEKCTRCFNKYCWIPSEGYQLDDWERASKTVDDINKNNLESLLDGLLGNVG